MQAEVQAGDEYFDERMVNRERLLWAIATRRQLERWEPYVAAAVLRMESGGELVLGPVLMKMPSLHQLVAQGRVDRDTRRSFEFESPNQVVRRDECEVVLDLRRPNVGRVGRAKRYDLDDREGITRVLYPPELKPTYGAVADVFGLSRQAVWKHARKHH